MNNILDLIKNSSSQQDEDALLSNPALTSSSDEDQILDPKASAGIIAPPAPVGPALPPNYQSIFGLAKGAIPEEEPQAVAPTIPLVLAPPAEQKEIAAESDDDEEEEAPKSKIVAPPSKQVAAAPLEEKANEAKDNSSGDFDQAIHNRNYLQLLGGLNKAGALAAQGFSKGASKADYTIGNDILTQANQLPKDLSDKQSLDLLKTENKLKASDLLNEVKRRDPNSEVSKAYREFVKTAAPQLAAQPDFLNLSAEGVKDILPGIDLKMKMDMLKEQKSREASDKSSAAADKEFAQFTKDIDMPYTARSGTALGQAANSVRRAEALQAFAAVPDTNKLTGAQMQELASSLDSIIRGGNTSKGTIEKLVPKTARSSAAKTLEWITNEPQGTKQKEFIDIMLKAADREKTIGLKQIQDWQARRAAMVRKAKDLPEFKAALDSKGLSDLTEQARQGKQFNSAQDYIDKQKQNQTFPRQVRKDGKVATINNDAQLKEAQSEGWQ